MSPFYPIEDGYRHPTADYVRTHGLRPGWYQDGRRLRHVKTSKAFIWPKDGRNGSTWGRMKDVIQNKGPDIHIAFGAHKDDCVSNRPTRAQWSGHSNLDHSGMTSGFRSQKFAPWTKRSILGGRAPGMCYDFRTRKHGLPHSYMWSDAIWQQDPYRNRKSNLHPEAVRMMDGDWWQDHSYLPQFLGGYVDNESGRGVAGFHLPWGPWLPQT